MIQLKSWTDMHWPKDRRLRLQRAIVKLTWLNPSVDKRPFWFWVVLTFPQNIFKRKEAQLKTMYIFLKSFVEPIYKKTTVIQKPKLYSTIPPDGIGIYRLSTRRNRIVKCLPGLLAAETIGRKSLDVQNPIACVRPSNIGIIFGLGTPIPRNIAW